MSEEDPRLSLPFDQYQRYRLVADLLEVLRGEKGELVVLDVGGRTALLRRFLPDDRVHLVDVEESEEAGLVLGDGAALPFADSCVDAVVTIDTLEHVPPGGRESFVAECARVARRWVVLAGPFATEGVAEAESHLSAFLKGKLGIEHRYLNEHSEHGLPELPGTEDQLRALGGSVRSVGHANLERWLALMCLAMYVDRDAPLRTIAKDFYRFYNAALFAQDRTPPVYRHAVVAALDGAELPPLETLSGAAPAPPGTFESLGHLTAELLGFDLERDVIKREWARLEEVNRDLELDLEGHGKTLAEASEIRVEQDTVIEELREDVEALRGHVTELEQELGRERRDSGETISILQTDLEGHRAALGDLERELVVERERLERQIEEQAAEIEARGEALTGQRVAFEEVQAGLREEIAALHGEVEARDGELSRVVGELAGERERIAHLRAELASRWKNLKRVFGKKHRE